MTASPSKGAAPSSSGGPQAAEKSFDRLYAQAWELTKLFPEYQFRFSATMAVVLGWILTSKETQQFIKDHGLLCRYGTIILTATLVVFHSRWVLKHARQAHLCYAELEEASQRIAGSSSALLEGVRLIDRFLPLSYIIVNVLLCGAICLVVLSI